MTSTVLFLKGLDKITERAMLSTLNDQIKKTYQYKYYYTRRESNLGTLNLINQS